MFRKRFFTAIAMAFMAILLIGCTLSTLDRADFDNDCDYARARYDEAQKNARHYYMFGTTTVAETAVVEKRVNDAKKQREAACGE